eukprot:gene16918-biopygen6798
MPRNRARPQRLPAQCCKHAQHAATDCGEWRTKVREAARPCSRRGCHAARKCTIGAARPWMGATPCRHRRRSPQPAEAAGGAGGKCRDSFGPPAGLCPRRPPEWGRDLVTLTARVRTCQYDQTPPRQSTTYHRPMNTNSRATRSQVPQVGAGGAGSRVPRVGHWSRAARGQKPMAAMCARGRDL